MNDLLFVVRCGDVKQHLMLFLFAGVFLAHRDGAFQSLAMLRRHRRCSGGQSKFLARPREERLRSRRKQTLHEAPKLYDNPTSSSFYLVGEKS